MNALRFVSLLVVAAIGLSSPAAIAQPKMPADFTFDQGKDSPGKVTFSHAKHKERVEKCTSCHVKVFKMKRGQSGAFTMDRMKAGELCGSCHNGKTEIDKKVVFAVAEKASCETCHKK